MRIKHTIYDLIDANVISPLKNPNVTTNHLLNHNAAIIAICFKTKPFEPSTYVICNHLPKPILPEIAFPIYLS